MRRLTPFLTAAALLPAVLLPAVLLPAVLGAQTWTQLAATGPSPRRNAAAIYDPAAHRVVLFGGRSADGDHNDVWALDLVTETWSEITPDDDGPTPQPRFTHNAVYDAAAHRALIWSGRLLTPTSSVLLNDVWAFDLSSDRWQALEAATEPPIARYGTAAVFDPVAGQLVTFAGFTTAGRFDDTYRFDPDTGVWVDVSPASGQPGKRCLHVAAYDAPRHRMIIFGGQRGNDSLDDAWAFDLAGGTWSALASAPQTGGRRFPAAAYDPVEDRFLAFGGLATDGSKGGDLWALDLAGDAWTQVSSSGPAPRDGAVLVSVPGLARLVLFGGTGQEHLGDPWVYPLTAAPTAVASAATSSAAVPAAARLTAYPNPFNAHVSLEVEADAGATLRVYDTLGRVVRDLGRLAPGRHRVRWDGVDDAGRPVGTGVYVAQLRTATSRQTRRLVLLR